MPAYTRRITPVIKARIVELSKQGHNASIISERLGICVSTVNYLLRKYRKEEGDG